MSSGDTQSRLARVEAALAALLPELSAVRVELERASHPVAQERVNPQDAEDDQLLTPTALGKLLGVSPAHARQFLRDAADGKNDLPIILLPSTGDGKRICARVRRGDLREWQAAQQRSRKGKP